MQRSKLEFALASHNVANAEDPNYIRISLDAVPSVAGNVLNGVQILGVAANIDEVLQLRLYNKIAQDSYDQTINDYFTQVSTEFGDPSDVRSINNKISTLFSSLEDFSRNPASASNKSKIVEDFYGLASSISMIANSLESLRLDVDVTIYNEITKLNNLLESAYNLSHTIQNLPQGSIERVDAEVSFIGFLEDISEYFDLYIYKDNMNRVNVLTKQGDNLIGDAQYFFKYTPQSNIDAFVKNVPMNSIYLNALDASGYDINLNKPIIPANISSEMPNKYTSGKIGALLALRDTLVPQALNQLDNLAKNIKDSFNQAHNNGCGFPPPTILTSTNLMQYDSILGFTGKTRIAVVDDNGEPIPNVPALTLDLGALDTGNGAGKANLEGLIQEIKYHFGQKLVNDKSIQLGNLKDIRLASLSTNIAPSSSLVLDLELENYSPVNSTVQILSVTATDSLATNVLGSFNNTAFTSTSGTTQRTESTGPSITLNLPAAINYPITVDVQVNVNNGASNIATLRYVINSPSSDPINGYMNQRFAVNSKPNPADPGTIVSPTIPLPILTAQMVDETGKIIPISAGASGLLQIEGLNSGYHIAIDNLDSNNIGDLSSNLLGTNLNFSQHLGLNDIFVRTDTPANWHDLKNSAMYLDIRNDIKNNVNTVAHSKITSVVNYLSPTQNTYQYQVSTADNSTVLDMIALGQGNIFFAPSSGLPGYETTLSNYASAIISFNVNRSNTLNLQALQSKHVREAFFDKIQGSRGVDVNEEMTNMIIYQQSFAASAKSLQYIKEIMDMLVSVL
ncbi:MAG: flagellar hook-associated protein FlgK [Candidatus Midichloriaceae bacterium]|jgi:flagellar hook-associated protein 1 FlgK|nr:flagellar hook-associated protein FlgK [Candidatus Midichloriaceae bacterium]